MSAGGSQGYTIVTYSQILYSLVVMACQSCRPLPMSAPRLSTRPVATGGGGGGAQPPWTNLSPPRLPVPFAVTIGIEVYPPPPEFCQPPPLLTIPGYGAAQYPGRSCPPPAAHRPRKSRQWLLTPPVHQIHTYKLLLLKPILIIALYGCFFHLVNNLTA